MTNEKLWSMYFVGICSIRFHPKNDALQEGSDTNVVHYAATIADKMLDEHHKRWPVETED